MNLIWEKNEKDEWDEWFEEWFDEWGELMNEEENWWMNIDNWWILVNETGVFNTIFIEKIIQKR